MQKHCIEVTKASIHLLNPDQIIADVSDEPLYALSKLLQMMFPTEPCPGNCFAIFCELHIEKVDHSYLINLKYRSLVPVMHWPQSRPHYQNTVFNRNLPLC